MEDDYGTEFQIPNAPSDLLEAGVQDLLGDEPSKKEITELAERTVYDICANDALCVNDEDTLNQLYTLSRHFNKLGGATRMRFVDSLCSNLAVLASSTSRMMLVEEELRQEATVAHRSSIKVYVFFLHWMWSQADRESREENNQKPADGKGRRGTAKHPSIDWCWDSARKQILSALVGIVSLDLWALFRPSNPPEALLLRFSHMGQWALRDSSLTKEPKSREAASHVICATALKYNQLEGMAAPLVQLLSDHEHLPQIFADMAALGATSYKDARLAGALMREIAKVDPASYKEQQSTDSKGLRSAAQFLEKIAAALPEVAVAHASLFAAHLGGEAYSLRSAIITMFGHCVHQGFGNGDIDERDRSARIKSKQSLLDTLLERIRWALNGKPGAEDLLADAQSATNSFRDQNAFTRARALHTWAFLAENTSIPISLWIVVGKLAIGRLQDKAAIVRKAAMQLLQAMLTFNPFGAVLALDRFQATLRDTEAQLAAKEAKEQEARFKLMSTDIEAAIAGDAVAAPEPTEVMMRDSNKESDNIDPAEENSAKVKVEEARSIEMSQEYQVATEDLEGGEESLPYLAATLKIAVYFIRMVSSITPMLQQLLASGTITDINEAINLVTAMYTFKVDGSATALRSMIPLVFSREESVRKSIVEAVSLIFLSGHEPVESATSLLALVRGSSVGDLAALEEVVGFLVRDGGQMDGSVLWELWNIVREAGSHSEGMSDQNSDLGQASIGWARCSMQLLSMVARHRPSTVSQNLDVLLNIVFGALRSDLLIVRHGAICVKHAGEYLALDGGCTSDDLASLVKHLISIILSPSLPDSQWFSATEAAVSALYEIHPKPDILMAAIIQGIAEVATPAPAEGLDGRASVACSPRSGCASGAALSDDDDGDHEELSSCQIASDTGMDRNISSKPSSLSAIALSRLLFTVGHVAIEQLIYNENIASLNKKQIAMQGKKVIDSQQPAASQEDIGAELGVGANSATAEADIEVLKDTAERELVSSTHFLGKFLPLVQSVCHSRQMMESHFLVRSSASLSLSKLMIMDETICEANLPLVFSLLQNSSMEASIRCNLIVACGDLFVRFPNSLEPWTGHLYQALNDMDKGVRKTGIMVITHLILNDMMKVKGHIAAMAVCLQDEDERICELARLFFHELASKSFKNTNPVFSLLPDILSSLSSNMQVPTPKFRAIMKHLLGLVSKDKHMDALVEKMCHRMSATDEPARWKDIAFCMSQLSFTDKGLRTLVDSFNLYKHALHDDEVAETIKAVLANARKGGGSDKAGTREALLDFETMFAAYTEERKEEAAAVNAAKRSGHNIDAGGSIDQAGDVQQQSPRESHSEAEESSCDDDDEYATPSTVKSSQVDVTHTEVSSEDRPDMVRQQARPMNILNCNGDRMYSDLHGECQMMFIKPDPDSPSLSTSTPLQAAVMSNIKIESPINSKARHRRNRSTALHDSTNYPIQN